MVQEFSSFERLLAIPIYLLILLTALFLHEMGHYLAARIFKIPIQDIVIGAGRPIKSWKSKAGHLWEFRLWPIGAHVHLNDINKVSFIKRIMTIIAGPLINFMIVPILFFAFYMAFGQPSIPNKVVGVERGLVADKAGIQKGDKFIAVNGIPLNNYDDIWRIAYDRGAVESTYTIQRDNKTFDVNITPDWVEYTDLRGVPRENARLGITWNHAPLGLKSITKINGEDVEDNEDLTRERLIQNFDQDITINIETPLNEQNPIDIHLRGDINQNLLDEDEDFYDAVFLGSTKGNVYQRGSLNENIAKTARYTSALFINIIKIPFQLFPIDKAMIQDKAAVSDPDLKALNRTYSIMHLFAVASIVIGLINLLPFPRLDGGQLIDQILKKICGDKVTNKLRGNVFAGAFLLLYASIFISNMDNLHGYIDSRVKKVHEFIDQKITNTEDHETIQGTEGENNG